MKYILSFFAVLTFVFGFSQQIESKQYGFALPASERQRPKVNEINGFTDAVTRIELVRILPTCRMDTIYNDTNDLWRIGKICRMNSVIRRKNDDETAWVVEKLIGQKVMLSNADVEQVFKGLYCTTGDFYVSPCYEPRHGIYFYGENDCFLGFAEICFTCSQVYTLNLPGFTSCSQDGFNILTALFRKYSMIDPEEE